MFHVAVGELDEIVIHGGKSYSSVGLGDWCVCCIVLCYAKESLVGSADDAKW
jgi:hypothetical protein